MFQQSEICVQNEHPVPPVLLQRCFIQCTCPTLQTAQTQPKSRTLIRNFYTEIEPTGTSNFYQVLIQKGRYSVVCGTDAQYKL